MHLEHEIINFISRCASACDFQSSPWNQQLGEAEGGVLVRESTAYTGGNESYDFECVKMEEDVVSTSHRESPLVGIMPGTAVKCTLVMGNEYGTRRNYSLSPRPNECTHVTMENVLKRRLTVEAMNRIARSNERFAKTILMLLELIKPYSLT